MYFSCFRFTYNILTFVVRLYPFSKCYQEECFISETSFLRATPFSFINLFIVTGIEDFCAIVVDNCISTFFSFQYFCSITLFYSLYILSFHLFLSFILSFFNIISSSGYHQDQINISIIIYSLDSLCWVYFEEYCFARGFIKIIDQNVPTIMLSFYLIVKLSWFNIQLQTTFNNILSVILHRLLMNIVMHDFSGMVIAENYDDFFPTILSIFDVIFVQL